MKTKIYVILLLITLFSGIIRFYQLNNIPAGVFIDEASHGYNAYSLLLTGKDEWGKSFPIFLRSFGTYPSSLYTFLSIPIIKILDLSPFSIRFLSSLMGVILVISTFVIIYLFEGSKSLLKSITGALFVSIVPWAVLFSRAAIEANLALTIVVISVFFLLLSTRKAWFFILGSILMAVSAYAYHGERIFGFIFIGSFIFLYKELWKLHRKIVIVGLALFIIIQMPHIVLLNKEGSVRRFNQLNYLTDEFYQENGKEFQGFVFGKQIFVAREFSSQYIAYFSPRNLFSDPDPQPVRSIPNLSVFYIWMIIPLMFGIRAFWKNRKNLFFKILFAIVLISPISAAIVRDPFYTLRTLPGFWAITIIISLGFVDVFQKRFGNFLTYLALFAVIIFSLLNLYSAYFVLLKHERSNIYGFQYEELSKIIDQYPGKHFLIDTAVDYPTYIWLAFYKKINPHTIQSISGPRINNDYYGNIEFNPVYELDNIKVKPIFWEDDVYKDQIIVSNPIGISSKQAEEHELTKLFEIKDKRGQIALVGYLTNPSAKCANQKVGVVKCKEWL